MLDALIWVVVGLLALYTLGLASVAWLTLHPVRVPIFLSPGALGLPQEPVSFQSADGTQLKGWWMDHPNPTAVVVLAHGFMMNRAEPIPMAKRLYEAGYACLVFDFRAHGSSAGKRCTIGWKERLDAAAALAHARERYPNRPCLGWGSSMGGAALTLAVAHERANVDALILDSTYTRLYDSNCGWWRTFFGPIGQRTLQPTWIFGWLFSGVDPRKVDIAQALESVKVPVLLLYGDLDLIVPPEHARRNFAATSKGTLHFFEGVQHSQPRWFQTQKYDAHVFEFLERHGYGPAGRLAHSDDSPVQAV